MRLQVDTMTESSAAKALPFLINSKSAKGAACVQLVKDALAAPGLYVFAELLDMPNVQDLANDPSSRPWHRLLQIFSYGTYGDYKTAGDLPTLTEAQAIKLKHLSIVTMSETSRILAYEHLMTALDIPNVRQLEDLVIEATYAGVIKAKLDQKKKELQVHQSMGRDLAPGQLDNMLATLTAWADTSDTLLRTIDNRIADVHKFTAAQRQRKERREAEIERVKKEIKADNPADVAEDFDGMEGIEHESKRDTTRTRAKRSRRG